MEQRAVSIDGAGPAVSGADQAATAPRSSGSAGVGGRGWAEAGGKREGTAGPISAAIGVDSNEGHDVGGTDLKDAEHAADSLLTSAAATAWIPASLRGNKGSAWPAERLFEAGRALTARVQSLVNLTGPDDDRGSDDNPGVKLDGLPVDPDAENSPPGKKMTAAHRGTTTVGTTALRLPSDNPSTTQLAAFVNRAMSRQEEINRASLELNSMNYAICLANVAQSRRMRQRLASTETQVCELESSLQQCDDTIGDLNRSIAGLEDQNTTQQRRSERLRADLAAHADLLERSVIEGQRSRLAHDSVLAQQQAVIRQMVSRRRAQHRTVDAGLALFSFIVANTTLVDWPIRLALTVVPRSRVRGWLRQLSKAVLILFMTKRLRRHLLGVTTSLSPEALLHELYRFGLAAFARSQPRGQGTATPGRGDTAAEDDALAAMDEPAAESGPIMFSTPARALPEHAQELDLTARVEPIPLEIATPSQWQDD